MPADFIDKEPYRSQWHPILKSAEEREPPFAICWRKPLAPAIYDGDRGLPHWSPEYVVTVGGEIALARLSHVEVLGLGHTRGGGPVADYERQGWHPRYSVIWPTDDPRLETPDMPVDDIIGPPAVAEVVIEAPANDRVANLEARLARIEHDLGIEP